MSDSNFNLYGDVCAPSDDFLYGQEGYATEDDGSTYGVDYRRKDLPKESPKEELGADGIDKSDQQEGSFSEKSAPADNQLLIGDGDEATQRQPAEVVAGLDPAIPTADGIDNAEGFRSVDGVRDSDEIAPRGSVPVPDDSVGSDLQRSAMSASVVTGSTLKNESPGAVVKTGFESAQPRALILEDLNWWTSDEDLTLAVAEAGVLGSLIPSELGFSEHRVNGKSKGVCFIPFTSSAACMKAKDFFERIALPRDPKQTRIESATRRPAAQPGGGDSTQGINLGAQLMGSVGSRTHSNSNFGYSRPYGVPAHLHENSMYRDGQPSQFYSLPIGVPVQKGFGVRAGAGGIGTGKNMHITPPVGGYFDSDSLYNPIHLGGMGYYPMEYEYDNWMGRIGNGGASAQNLPLRLLPSNIYMQPGSSVARKQIGMEHAPGGNFSNSSNPAAVGRFRAPFQGSNAGQRLANAQNSRDPAADRKATRHKFKQAPVEKHEPPFPPQDEDKEGFHRKNQAEYDQHQRLSNLSSGSYYRSDAPQSSYPQQARYAPHDKTPRQESQRFNRHASAVRAPDASPVDDAARRPAWGSMYETNYSNDTAPIPTSPNEIDANPQDGHYPNNPNRGRDRDKGKRFNDPSELGEPPPRGRVHGSPNKKQIRANSYRPQPNRSAEAHEKPRRSLSEIRDPALGDRASSIGHSFRYKSPPPGSVDRPNKPHKPSQSPTEASDHPYHLGPQPVPFNRDEYSPQRLQPSQPQANDNNSARPRSRQKVHTSAPEKEPENALNPRPQTQKRGTFPNSKPHEPQGPAPTHPQGAPKSPPPYRVGENRPNVSPNPDSPTWSQPCRLKKKSTKEWPRSPEKDAHYPEQEFTQRDRGISFMRNGTDTKRQKHKSNASDYHNGGGMKRSRGHDRNGERGSASWKIRRQH